MKATEKAGTFYLGKAGNEALLYDSKNLTTHAVCVGMTGSGKTGLGIALLEEAALNKIPAIIIDPKGDLGDLLLTFPHLSPSEFLPWIDTAEAERKGLSPEAYAKEVATTWQKGLAKWQEGPERIQKLRETVDMVIYTPASKAGIPLSILSSFAVPPKELMLDSEAVRERILSITSSLLGLLGIDADPIKSREYILISTIISNAWSAGKNLDIPSLIQQIQKPPFDKVGALNTDTFFPLKERLALSISLNNLLASPGFQAWMEGEPLDIQKLLFTASNKPKLAIISIAHLSNSERMFFVTLLLNELLGWMRRQPGTSNLRALLYMDEIFGFFPPTSMPPSKIPMLTLLKQARAFGLGIVLATQNPVDLDYKGLANCGTWFIGKLQTERDRSRVIQGLQVSSNESLSSGKLDTMIAATGNRIFILRSIYEKDPILFETRWTLSYLRGPLTLAQISALTPTSEQPATPKLAETKSSSEAKPIIPPGVSEFFVRQPNVSSPTYKPMVMGLAKVHFIDTKNKIDSWHEICLIAPPADEGSSIDWEEGKNIPDLKNKLDRAPLTGSSFEELPAGLMQAKNYSAFEKSLATSLYQNQTITLYQSTALNQTSQVDESEADFRARLTQAILAKRSEALQKIQTKYADKMALITERLKRAQDKMSEKQKKSFWRKVETAINFLTTLLGAFVGRGLTKGTITQAGTSVRRMERLGKDSQGVTQAEDDVKTYQDQLDNLRLQQDSETAQVTTSLDPNNISLEKLTIRPRKSDIAVEKVALLWWPS